MPVIGQRWALVLAALLAGAPGPSTRTCTTSAASSLVPPMLRPVHGPAEPGGPVGFTADGGWSYGWSAIGGVQFQVCLALLLATAATAADAA